MVCESALVRQTTEQANTSLAQCCHIEINSPIADDYYYYKVMSGIWHCIVMLCLNTPARWRFCSEATM